MTKNPAVGSHLEFSRLRLCDVLLFFGVRLHCLLAVAGLTPPGAQSLLCKHRQGILSAAVSQLCRKPFAPSLHSGPVRVLGWSRLSFGIPAGGLGASRRGFWQLSSTQPAPQPQAGTHLCSKQVLRRAHAGFFSGSPLPCSRLHLSSVPTTYLLQQSKRSNTRRTKRTLYGVCSRPPQCSHTNCGGSKYNVLETRRLFGCAVSDNVEDVRVHEYYAAAGGHHQTKRVGYLSQPHRND